MSVTAEHSLKTLSLLAAGTLGALCPPAMGTTKGDALKDWTLLKSWNQGFHQIPVLGQEADKVWLTPPSGAPLTKYEVESGLIPSKVSPLDGFERYSQDDWDGEGAEKISEETLALARRFLLQLPTATPLPDAAPGEDGSVGLEWVYDRGPIKKTFIDIGPADVLKIYSRRVDGEVFSTKLSTAEFLQRSLAKKLF